MSKNVNTEVITTTVTETPAYKNIWTWISLGSVIFLAAEIDISSLTSWNLFFQSIWDLLSNPARLIATFGVVFGGIWNNIKTPGLDIINSIKNTFNK